MIPAWQCGPAGGCSPILVLACLGSDTSCWLDSDIDPCVLRQRGPAWLQSDIGPRLPQSDIGPRSRQPISGWSRILGPVCPAPVTKRLESATPGGCSPILVLVCPGSDTKQRVTGVRCSPSLAVPARWWPLSDIGPSLPRQRQPACGWSPILLLACSGSAGPLVAAVRYWSHQLSPPAPANWWLESDIVPGPLW